MVPCCMGMDLVGSKCKPRNLVYDSEYILPTMLTASSGFPRFDIIAKK